MLEPLFKCNLACSGCGRIREYKDVLNHKLTKEECMEAASQADAPIVSITGGEPLLHPEIKSIIRSLLTVDILYIYVLMGFCLKIFWMR